MTTTVDLPSSIEKAIREKVEEGEYTSKSDFIKEAVRTHLDKILLTPEEVAERAEEVRKGVHLRYYRYMKVYSMFDS